LLRAQRSANGYRDYGEDDLRLVNEIRALQTVGLTLDDTRRRRRVQRLDRDLPAQARRGDAFLEQLTVVRAELAGKLTDALARRSCPEQS
jgi:DNA-binding transcriptional MerR regulator